MPETEDSSSNEKTDLKPASLYMWMWNMLSSIPQKVNHIYTDIKSGEFLSRFTLLDAILQFIFALATSCHPPDDGLYDRYEEDKSDKHTSGKKHRDGVEVFGGQGRTLRSRSIDTN